MVPQSYPKKTSWNLWNSDGSCCFLFLKFPISKLYRHTCWKKAMYVYILYTCNTYTIIYNHIQSYTIIYNYIYTYTCAYAHTYIYYTHTDIHSYRIRNLCIDMDSLTKGPCVSKWSKWIQTHDAEKKGLRLTWRLGGWKGTELRDWK
jgi:hypothetical protein